MQKAKRKAFKEKPGKKVEKRIISISPNKCVYKMDHFGKVLNWMEDFDMGTGGEYLSEKFDRVITIYDKFIKYSDWVH